MNNKGQSLALFILLIPFVFVLSSVIIELGSRALIQNKYESEIKETIKYYLNHETDENIENKVKNLLDNNIDGEKNIQISDGKIKVNVQKPYNSMYKKIIKNKLDIDITYTGYKEEDKNIINKE